jgi:diguanylate cyclase (GGDEF)-like protein
MNEHHRPEPPLDTTDEPLHDLTATAHEARQAGEFDRAAGLFAQAASVAAGSSDEQLELHLQIRQACCLLAVEKHADAAALAQVVAQRARAEGFLPELADALGVIVDHHSRSERLAEAANVLSEAAYILEQLPNEPENFQVVQNMAATYAHCGFIEAALQLYDRALRLADNDPDRQFVYANMAAAYHYAAQREPDPQLQYQLLHDGLYAATAALDPEGAFEVMAMGAALAHRSMMLSAIGHYSAALDDARRGQEIAIEHGLGEETVVAMAGEAIAKWRSSNHHDVYALVQRTLALADELNLTSYVAPLQEVEVEILWSMGRLDEGRAALERQLHDVSRRLSDERAARWEHVRLGVDHRRVEAISESDPLTGLPNRRHLAHLLPKVLDDHPPVVVGVIDLDGFKNVNDDYGYLQGDLVLQEIGGVLERVCRRGDSVARLGGDEFVMILRETSPGDAKVVFERVRSLIAHRTWHGLPGDYRLTASVGMSVASTSDDTQRVLADATAALQLAKKSGRDRITAG